MEIRIGGLVCSSAELFESLFAGSVGHARLEYVVITILPSCSVALTPSN